MRNVAFALGVLVVGVVGFVVYQTKQRAAAELRAAAEAEAAAADELPDRAREQADAAEQQRLIRRVWARIQAPAGDALKHLDLPVLVAKGWPAGPLNPPPADAADDQVDYVQEYALAWAPLTAEVDLSIDGRPWSEAVTALAESLGHDLVKDTFDWRVVDPRAASAAPTNKGAEPTALTIDLSRTTRDWLGLTSKVLPPQVRWPPGFPLSDELLDAILERPYTASGTFRDGALQTLVIQVAEPSE